MAKKATEKIRVNTTRYLDEDGLEILWKKIKKYVQDNAIEIDGGNINLSNYATIEYVTEALANIDTSDIDLTAYATKDELTKELVVYAKKEDIPSIEGFATKSYVDHAISTVDSNPGVYIGTNEPADPGYSVWIDTDDGETAALDNYYTKAEVDAMTFKDSFGSNIDLSDYAKVDHTHVMADITDYSAPTTDLSNYYNKAQVDEKIAEAQLEGKDVDLSGYALKDHTHDQYLTAHQDLSAYAKKTEIPDVSAFITKVPDEYVTETELNGKGYLTQHQSLTDYATKTYVQNQIDGLDLEVTVEGIGKVGTGTAAEIFNYDSRLNTDITASGRFSHAENYQTIASGDYSHVQGKLNIEDTDNRYAHIVGNGDASKRSNAHTLDWNGNAWFAGKVYVGGTSMDDATELTVGSGGSVDLSNYYNKEEVESAIDVKVAAQVHLTETQVNTLIDNKLGVIVNGTY